MGKHIFPLTLNLLSEWNESQSMIDILNRLEKLHFIKQATFWQYLREVRNEITHEYENKPEQQAEKILLAIKAAKELLIVWNHFENESKSSSALKSYF